MPKDSIFENPFLELLTNAYAQNVADTIVSPTLDAIVDPNLVGTITPTPTPTETITPTTSGTKVSLLLQTQQTIELNDTFNVSLEIESGTTQIKGFTITISYDPNTVSIENSTYSDTYFTSNNEIIENQAAGEIVIVGNAQADPVTINRAIAQLTFRAQSPGDILISIDQDSARSSIFSSSNTNVLGVVQNLELQVGSMITTTPTPSITQPIKELPKNDFDDIAE
ncbi:hypothetical protein KC717_02955, partial [Candidatus Dojkabacteria bacterium]|nr:hypothetical protein [Candidatus Dojkabacteria bacterium]